MGQATTHAKSNHLTYAIAVVLIVFSCYADVSISIFFVSLRIVQFFIYFVTCSNVLLHEWLVIIMDETE
jgi:hypothetical protein